MYVVAQGRVYSGEEAAEHQSCSFPQIAVLPSGRWVCIFRAAPAKAATRANHVLMTWSDDEGDSWSEPIEPFTAPTEGDRPGMLRMGACCSMGGTELLAALCWVNHSNPDRPLFNEKTEGVLDTLILLARSRDEGQTWSRPEFVDTSPFPKGLTCLTGPVLRLASGELACQFEVDKAYDDPSPWHHQAAMVISQDGGKSWPQSGVAAADPHGRLFFWDQRPMVLPDGRLVDFFWTFDREQAVYLPIHAAESRDHARTWSPVWSTGVPGQPARPVVLPDGRLVLIYVDRSNAPAIKARVSSDCGRTWPQDTELLLAQPALGTQVIDRRSMQDAWTEMTRFSIGLPDAALTTGGEVVAVFYHGPDADHTHIEWVRLRIG